MQRFNSFLVEGAIGYADVFKRNNKQSFIDLAVDGKLVDMDGKKLAAIDPNSELIGYLKRDDADNTPEFQAALKRTYGVTSLSALNIDKIANGFSTTSGKNAKGEDWESIITHHYNILLNKEGADSAATEHALKFDDWHQDAGREIAKAFLETLNDKSGMTQFGTGSGKLSSFWLSWGAKNKTPKTDMYTKDYNISLKKAGGSQLASGAKEETIATYQAALEYMGHKGVTPEMEKILKMIEDGFHKVATKHTVTELGKLAKKDPNSLSDKDKKAVSEFTETAKFHTELNKQIKKHLNFHEQPEFLKWYTYEAMSGYKKFEGDRYAPASVCIEFDADKGKVAKFIEVTVSGKSGELTNNPSAGSEVIRISKKVKVYAAYKSSGGNPYSTLRLGLAEDNKNFVNTPTLAGIIREEIMNDKITGMLVEDRHQLDEFQIIKKVFSKLKKIGKDVKIWFSNLLNRIMERVKKVFEQIKNMGSKMYQALLGFLNLEIDKVKTSYPKDLEGFI